jgi:hypothetical protein
MVMATVTLVALDLRLEGGIFGGSSGIEEARTMAKAEGDQGNSERRCQPEQPCGALRFRLRMRRLRR